MHSGVRVRSIQGRALHLWRVVSTGDGGRCEVQQVCRSLPNWCVVLLFVCFVTIALDITVDEAHSNLKVISGTSFGENPDR